MQGVQELRDLVGSASWRRWAMAAFSARLPTTMTLLALILVGEHATGSLATGAQLAGVATITTGLASPWRGRLLDRHELRGGLQRATLLSAAVIAGQAVAVAVGAPVPVLFALAVAQGAAMAAIMGGFRALLVPSVTPAQLPRANSFDAIFTEVAFVAGPAIAGAVAWLLDPVGVLVVMASAMVMSALLARRLPQVPPSGTTEHGAAPWRAPGTLPVYGLAAGVGIGVGLLESAIPARLTELGSSAEAGGTLLVLVALGSVVGGVASSFLSDPLGVPPLRAAGMLGGMALLFVPVALAGSVPLLVVALFFSGLFIAPLNALGALVLQGAIPPGRRTEGFAVYTAAIMLGLGTGQSLTGVLLRSASRLADGAVLTPGQVALLGSVVVPLLLSVALFAAWTLLRRQPDRELVDAAA